MIAGEISHFGIDTLPPATLEALQNARSDQYLGAMPSFWGRYIHATGQRNVSGHVVSHYSKAENNFLRSHNIKLLLIARQTFHVSRDDQNLATLDAKRNVDAIFEVLPQSYLALAQPHTLVFLDVEQNNPLAPAYYAAWSSTLRDYSRQMSAGRISLQPAIYGAGIDGNTWAAMRVAMQAGSACAGIWSKRYYYPDPHPRPWEYPLIAPKGGSDCPVLAWQYWASEDDAPKALNFDLSLASPVDGSHFLDSLILPPGDEGASSSLIA